MTTPTPARRGPVPNPELAPKSARNKIASTAYYEKNALLIAERRVYARVKKTGVMPHSATMKKFNLSLNADNALVGFSPSILTPKTAVFVPVIPEPAKLIETPVAVKPGAISW